MSVSKCPHCKYAIRAQSERCPQCGCRLVETSTLPPVELPATAAGGPSALFVARKVVWALAFAALTLFAVDGFTTFDIQTGAPQQAAAAAAACFHMITVYVLARAADQLLRRERAS